MIERTRFLDAAAYVVLGLGVLVAVGPIYLVLASASVSNAELVADGVSITPGPLLLENLRAANERIGLGRLLVNSVIVATIVTAGKLALASLTAFAVVYFRSPFKTPIFFAVFLTLLVPLEVRLIPTYAAAADLVAPWKALLHGLGGIEINVSLNLLDSYAGLSLPLIASATGTFMFRQFFRTIPPELSEAARVDGAGPMRFFFDILLPLSKTNFAALGTLVFVGAWKDYTWPLLITTREDMRTVVLGVARFLPADTSELAEWNLAMAAAAAALAPPLLVVALMQRWFVKGLVGGDK